MTVCAAQAGEVAIRAPICVPSDFPSESSSALRKQYNPSLTSLDSEGCDRDISLVSIEASYEKDRKSLDKARVFELDELQRSHSEMALENPTPLIYLWALFVNSLCDSVIAHSYNWIPASSVSNGLTKLRELLARAKSGRPFGNGIRQQVIVDLPIEVAQVR